MQNFGLGALSVAGIMLLTFGSVLTYSIIMRRLKPQKIKLSAELGSNVLAAAYVKKSAARRLLTDRGYQKNEPTSLGATANYIIFTSRDLKVARKSRARSVSKLEIIGTIDYSELENFEFGTGAIVDSIGGYDDIAMPLNIEIQGQKLALLLIKPTSRELFGERYSVKDSETLTKTLHDLVGNN
jgi:hypothetical protein